MSDEMLDRDPDIRGGVQNSRYRDRAPVLGRCEVGEDKQEKDGEGAGVKNGFYEAVR